MNCDALIQTKAYELIDDEYYSACTYTKALGTKKIDSKLIKAVDCTIKICVTVLEGNKKGFSPFPDCTIDDTATGKPITLQTIKSLCDGIEIKSSLGTKYPSTQAPTNTTTELYTPSTWPTPGSTFVSSIPPPRSNTGMIIGSCAAFALVAAAIAFYIYRRTKTRQDAHFVGMLEENGSKGTVNQPTASNSVVTETRTNGGLDMGDLEMYRVSPTEVHLIKAIARGAFGEVWLGEYGGQCIAVKKLLANRTTMSDLQKFIWEIQLVTKIDCQYIVSFIAVTWTRPTDMLLLTEFMDGGDLRSVLESNTKKTFTWKQKLECAHRIAEALVYLHTMDPKVIHRDLKSRNVLLDSSKGAKITDFGIARESDDSTMTAGIGTYRWMAPEVLQDGHYSESADLFSLGVIFSELDTEILPYSDLRNDKGNPYTDTAIMAKVMTGNLLPSFTSNCPEWFVQLGLNCMALHPMDRPTSMEIAYQLRSQVRLL